MGWKENWLSGNLLFECGLVQRVIEGPLIRGPQCIVSILRKINENVACICRLFPPMSRVELKNGYIPCRYICTPHVACH